MDQANWAKSRYDEIQTSLKPFLYATGFTDDDLIWVPIVGLSGENILDPVEQKVANWYKGKTMIECLDEIKLEQRNPNAELRVPVLDKMRVDANLIVYGKVESGTVKLGEKLQIMPGNIPAQVLKLVDSRTKAVRECFPGDNIEIKMNVADDDQVQKGMVLCHRDTTMPITEIFEVDLEVLELPENHIITPGYSCMIHIHTYSDEVVIKNLVKVTTTNERGETTVDTKPKFARSNCRITARIATKTPIAIEKFDSIPSLARFTLRKDLRTIAIGKVLKIKPYNKVAIAAKAEALSKNFAGMQMVDATGGKEIKFNMETGETSEKKELPAISEE